MSKAYERIRAGYEYCRKVTDFEPKVARSWDLDLEIMPEI